MNTRSEASARTRQRLLDSALTLFSQRGYSATGIREILQASEVTQPTLYHHFADKASLLQALIDQHYGECHHLLVEVVSNEPSVCPLYTSDAAAELRGGHSGDSPSLQK